MSENTNATRSLHRGGVLPDTCRMDEHGPVRQPIDGILDLHTFDPAEVKDLVPDYLAECRASGILRVRIIHGKGTGALRETVHAALRRIDAVSSFKLAGEEEGGWGATLVSLLPPPPAPEDDA